MANLDLTKYGITGTTEIVHNPSYDVLFAEETKADLTGYEVGKVSELATKEDLALGLINMIFETIGMMAVFNSRMHKTRDIVLTGNLTQIAQAEPTFRTLSDMFDVNFIIPKRAQYSTVIGAALCTL